VDGAHADARAALVRRARLGIISTRGRGRYLGQRAEVADDALLALLEDQDGVGRVDDGAEVAWHQRRT
jgi:hypothetical protein